jgi:signal peptidase I
MRRRPEPARPSRGFRVFVVAETIVIALGIAFLIFGRAGFVGSPISYVVVSGHSMEPTFHTGDVVVLQRSARYRKGEVIGYKVPSGGPGAGLIVIHRVIGGDAGDGYLVRGDNKQFSDPWRPRPADVIGHEVLMVPKLGIVVRYVRSPLGFAAIAGLLTITIALGGGTSAPGNGEGSPESRIADRRKPAFATALLRPIVRAWARGSHVLAGLRRRSSAAASSPLPASHRRTPSAPDRPEPSTPASSSAAAGVTRSPAWTSRSSGPHGGSRSSSTQAAGSPAAPRASTPSARSLEPGSLRRR